MVEDFKWYAVHIYSGFENKIVDEILSNAKKAKLGDHIQEIYIPKEKVGKVVRGKRVMVCRSSFPGYILVKAKLSDHLFSIIKNTNRVTNFLCSGGNPVVISDKKIQEIKRYSEESLEQEEKEKFDAGEIVKINEGAFSGFNGLIKEVLEDEEKFKIEVTIFGRPVMIDLSREHIEKTKGE